MCVGCIAGPGSHGNYEEAINELYKEEGYENKTY